MAEGSPDPDEKRIRELERELGELKAKRALSTPAPAGPLAGIRIIDFTQYANGPCATGQLCDNGADVLKVEPAAGEGNHFVMPAGMFFAAHEAMNRGKRSLTLDLKHPEFTKVMERLVKWADVITNNYRPGVMEKLGLSYEVCKAWNPRIVYASNSGFGPEGEWSRRPSYDGMAQAFTGVLTKNGGGPSHTPRPVPWVFSDIAGANNFVSAILYGLVARERTGLGQKVTTSQTGATLNFQAIEVTQVLNNKHGVQDDSGKDEWSANVPFQHMHKTLDGKWIVMTPIQVPMLERWLTKALERPDLLTDRLKSVWPLFAGCPTSEEAAFRAEIAKEFAKRPREEWLDRMTKADVPVAPIATYAEVGDKDNTVGKHLRANGYMVEAEHRDFGPIRQVGLPVQFSGTPNRPLVAHGPYIGEHNDEVLMRDLGFSETEAAELKSKGVVPKPAGDWSYEGSKEKRQLTAAKLMKERNALAQSKL